MCLWKPRCLGRGDDLVVSEPSVFHLPLVQGHLLVSMVTKSSLAQEDPECKQQEPVRGCVVWEEDSPEGQGRKAWGPCRLGGSRWRNLFT